MAFVFISHAHEDRRIAERVARVLDEAGHKLWLDSAVRAGECSFEEMGKSIEKSDYLAIVYTKNAVSSHYVRIELSGWMADPKKVNRVIVLRFDETPMTGAFRLIAGKEWADFRSSFAQGSNKLLGALGEPRREADQNTEDRIRLDLAITAAIRAGSVAMRYYNSCLDQNRTLDERKNAATLADQAAQSEIISMIQSTQAYRDEQIVAEEKPYKTGSVPSQGYCWVIDALDGTTNFRNRIPLFCTAVGVLKDGIPMVGVIYDPISNELYYSLAGHEAMLWRISQGSLVSISVDRSKRKLSECAVGTHISSRPQKASWLFKRSLLKHLASKAGHVRMLGSAHLALAYIATGRLHAYLEHDIRPWDQVAGVAIVLGAGGKAFDLLSRRPWTAATSELCVTSTEKIARDLFKIVGS